MGAINGTLLALMTPMFGVVNDRTWEYSLVTVAAVSSTICVPVARARQ